MAIYLSVAGLHQKNLLIASECVIMTPDLLGLES